MLNTEWAGTVQCTAVLYSTVHCSAVQCSAVQYSAVPGTGAWHNRTGGLCQSVTWHLALTLGSSQAGPAQPGRASSAGEG